MKQIPIEWEAPLCSIDPITLGTLALGALVGGGAAAATGAFSGGGGEPAPPPTIEPPKATTPAANPIGSKPSKKSAQPSFLAGASMLPQAGGGGAGVGPSGGKTLLGQ